MNTDKDKMAILEEKIQEIVENIILEKKLHGKNSNRQTYHSFKGDNSAKKRGNDNVESSQAYKRQYKAIEKALDSPEVDATGVFVKAGVIPSADDDSARSHAFKKLHKDKTPDKTGRYKFSQSEVAKIFSALP